MNERRRKERTEGRKKERTERRRKDETERRRKERKEGKGEEKKRKMVLNVMRTHSLQSAEGRRMYNFRN